MIEYNSRTGVATISEAQYEEDEGEEELIVTSQEPEEELTVCVSRRITERVYTALSNVTSCIRWSYPWDNKKYSRY